MSALMNHVFTSDRHDALREEVRAFADQAVRPRVARMEDTREVDHELSTAIARRGWIGATIPAEYGGLEVGHLGKTIIIEELSRASAAMGAMVQASQLGVAKILHFGTEAQRRRWLPPIADGRCLPTIAVTEPESGGHVLGMSGTAVRDGDHYILNARKVFVGNSHVGHVHGVVVRTGAGSKGLSAFLVEYDRPGVRLEPLEPTMGLHGFSFGEIVMENCRIPVENRLGAEGEGLAVAYSSSTLYGRPNLTAVALGVHQAIVEDTVEYCRQRRLYDAPIADISSVKVRLGDMQSRLMTARLAAYHAVYLLDQGLPCDTELMNAKLVNVEYAIDSARAAMDVIGARGMQARYRIERYLRDAYHILAPAGTSDIQRLRLAEAAMSTGRGQWSERFAKEVKMRIPGPMPDLRTAPIATTRNVSAGPVTPMVSPPPGSPVIPGSPVVPASSLSQASQTSQASPTEADPSDGRRGSRGALGWRSR